MAVKNSKKTGQGKTGRRGRPFQKGRSGNPRGRPKGSTNKVTHEVREMSRALIEDPAYWMKFLKAWRARKITPRTEEMVWAYAYGKPAQAVDLTMTFDHEAYLAGKLEEVRQLTKRVH